MKTIGIKNGHLFVEGMPVCQVQGDNLIFRDKNRKRCKVRGREQVTVNLLDIAKVLSLDTKKRW